MLTEKVMSMETPLKCYDKKTCPKHPKAKYETT